MRAARRWSSTSIHNPTRRRDSACDSHAVGASIYEVLVNESVKPGDVIRKEIRPNLALLPAKVDLYAADIELVYLDNREYRMRHILDQIRNDYEFILIDCPPSLGLLTVNALTAADGVILPLQCEYFALEGMQQLLNTIRLVRDRLNNKVMLFGVVLTMFDSRTNLATEVVTEISQHFPKEKFDTLIPRNIRLSEAPSYGRTILEHDPRSPGALAYKTGRGSNRSRSQHGVVTCLNNASVSVAAWMR